MGCAMNEFQFSVAIAGKFVFRSEWMHGAEHIISTSRAMRELTKLGYEVIISTRSMVETSTRLLPDTTDEQIREYYFGA